MPKMTDLRTKNCRIAVCNGQHDVTLLIDADTFFTKASLTHQEARRLAFMLMGSADPYPDEKDA